jgi:hypothetical protein
MTMRHLLDSKPFAAASTGMVTAGTCYTAGCTNDWHLIALPLLVMLAHHLLHREWAWAN